MRAAPYLRVSTQEQAIDGYSISVQKEKTTQYCAAMSYDIYNTYSDEGFSGKSLVRPAMEQMLGDIKAGRIDIVIVHKLDRLSRHVKDVLELVELFDKYDVKLYSLSENLDLSSPFGRAALKMSATFSELERETIVERMQMGKDARAREGKYTVPGRHSPFGYKHDKENDRLIIDEREAEAVRKIFDLYVNQGYTFRKLYTYCKEAFPDLSYFTNEMCCKPIIERPMYAGYFRYKGGELIKGTNFEPIIPYETFLQAQACVERNKTKRSVENTPNLLTGLLLCGKCGNRYVGKLYDRYNIKSDGTKTKRYKYRSYGCAARIKRDKNYHPAKCDNIIIPTHELDEYVEDKVRRLNFKSTGEKFFVPGVIDSLMSEIAELKEKQAKLLDLYLDGTIDKDAYTLRLVALDAKINENKSIIESEKEKVVSAPLNSTEIIQDRIKNYDNLSSVEKSKLLKLLIKNIIINDEKITINWNIQ